MKKIASPYTYDLYEAFDALDTTIYSLRSLNSMLNFSLESAGGDLKPDAHGVYWLFRQQIDDLEVLRTEIHSGINKIKLDAFEQKDPENAARAFRVDVDTVIGIIRMMTGVDTSKYIGLKTQKPVENHATLIAEKLKGGVKAGPIAQALNMKQTTVERVIAQLVPDEPDLIPIIDKATVNG